MFTITLPVEAVFIIGAVVGGLIAGVGIVAIAIYAANKVSNNNKGE